MSRTKARVISSLRMRRCSQRRKMTNCTRTATSAVSQPMSAGQLELGKCIGIFSERYQEVRRLHGKEESRGLYAKRYSQVTEDTSWLEWVSLGPSCDAGIPFWLWCPAKSCSRCRVRTQSKEERSWLSFYLDTYPNQQQAQKRDAQCNEPIQLGSMPSPEEGV